MEAVETKTYTVLDLKPAEVLADYRLAYQSRQASLLGRREVLTGKAKFGIFGDGKEVAQVAMARAAQPGDIRSGYYRDQTFMFATGLSNIQKFFAQLYADTDLQNDPASGGRQMNSHFATRWIDENGEWNDLTQQVQSSADSSPTASQMPRMVGLAHASKLYRNLQSLQTDEFSKFSNQGNEIVFGTIGDASTSEGVFWETMNAVGVLQVPLLMSVWDDAYGISVPIEYQTTKGSISEIMKGFHPRKSHKETGVKIFTVKGWDYVELVATYQDAAKYVRDTHQPAMIHVQEVTQPQGHSTSGSHERYKSPERLQWEQEHDCLAKMRAFLLEEGIVEEEELAAMEKADKKEVSQWKKAAWKEFLAPISAQIAELTNLIEQLANELEQQTNLANEVRAIGTELAKLKEPIRRDMLEAVGKVLVLTAQHTSPARNALLQWRNEARQQGFENYSKHLYSETPRSPLKVKEVKPVLNAEGKDIPGFELLQKSFEKFFERYPNLVAFGEDLGYLGDVNQGMAGMQEKFGIERVFDTGIREATIAGQGIGLAMRGLRPIAEIQYLDYLLYAIQILSDDAATLRWRSRGGQAAPLIIRTRGHRLEGIWHSGSPMQMILGALRGMHVLVPRNMTQAAGFYNTILQGDDPALIIEVLNGYRLREPLPENIGEYTVPLGVPEMLREGTDITMVTYGANCRICADAADELAKLNINVELIDVQSLLPFDRNHQIVESLKKTSRLVVVDEDVRGGASAFILEQVLEEQGGYWHLDSQPVTITSQDHRPAYASDGDYFSKPNSELIVERTYALMHEFDPRAYPSIF